MAVSSVSYTKTPQAKDDLFTSLQTGLTEDSLGFVSLDVMANDLGGNAKTLYSVDDGTGATDLLTRDTARSEAASHDHSLNGASIWIGADGRIGYDASTLSAAFRAQLQTLGAGQSLEDTFTYAIQLGNGTISTATVVVRIAGLNDGPVITSAPQSGGVQEDVQATAAGQVTATDVDQGDHQHYALQGSGTGSYGLIEVNAGSGAWVYTLDNGSAVVQSLAAGETHVEWFTVRVTDDFGAFADQAVSITVTGTNDLASITGQDSASLTEDALAAVTGTLVVADVDTGEAHTTAASGTTDLGSWSVDGDGNWSYFVDNAEVQHLAHGTSTTDTFVVASLDGTDTQTISITINGVNDDATISGNSSGSLTEDASAAVTGTLVVADVDDGEAHTEATSGTTSLGAWGVDGDGNWSYTVDNSEVQHLAQGSSTSDSFVVVSLDGTDTQTVSITINGVNDIASISGTSSGTVVEAGSGNGGGTPVASGDLLATDADDGQADAFQAGAGTSANGYGSYTVSASGVWSYTLDNAHLAVNALNNGGSLSDSFTTTSVDGSDSQVVSITIQGATDNSPPVITSGATGSEPENSPATNIVYQAIATDADSDTISWSLGGADAARFGISASGAVTFNASPNFEAPTDAGLNNVYDISVVASDPMGASDSQNVAISVTNVVEPIILANDFDFLQSGTALQITINGATQTFAGFFGAGHSGTNTFALGDGQVASFVNNSFTFPAGTTFHGYAVAGTYTVNQGLSGGTGADIIASSNSAQSADGGNSNDIVFGNGGNDTLVGSQSSDLLLGGAGNDSLSGVTSDDVLAGGAGNDTLSGGNGKDRFVFFSSADGKDTISDFDASQDALDVHDALSAFVPGTSALGDFVKLTVSGGNTTLSVDADGLGSGSAFVDVAQLQGVTGLSLATAVSDGWLIV
jgi:VCBS repeat-containing protein